MTEDERKELQLMMNEVKRTLKPYSKNELIRMNVHLCVDNYMLKEELSRLRAVIGPIAEVPPIVAEEPTNV